jgi:hypothetical protein
MEFKWLEDKSNKAESPKMDYDKIKLIEVNSRYHQKRYQFFNRLAIMQRFIILAFGMSLAWVLFSGYINQYSGYTTSILAFLTLFDLIIDFSEKKYVHRRLSNDYLKLLRKYKSAGSEGSHTELLLLDYGKEILDEEKPPYLDSLYAMQYNVIFGHERYTVRWWNRIFSQFISYIYLSPLEHRTSRRHPLQSALSNMMEKD